MVSVSTKQFYFSQFGGYAGLRHVLEDDLVEIPNLQDGELTRPGTYLNVCVSQITRHGYDKYSVVFTAEDTYLHTQDCTGNTPWYKYIIQAGGLGVNLHSITLRRATNKYYTGYLNNIYYLINSKNQVVQEFTTAAKLREYCFVHNINTRGICIYELRHTKTGPSFKAY